MKKLFTMLIAISLLIVLPVASLAISDVSIHDLNGAAAGDLLIAWKTIAFYQSASQPVASMS